MTAVYGKNRSWKKGGILDAESVAKFNRTAMPEYMLVFLEYIDHYRSEHKSSPDENLAENRLLELYYEAMENSRNRFIAQWFRFDREIKNIQAAYSARQQGIPAEDHLIKIKDDDITEFLLKNTSLPEFGLLRERDYMPTLFPTLEIQNPAEREYRLDMLRWQQIDEINVGEYFSVDVVLGTLTKACIADRWMALNVDEGKKLFRQLIDSLINYDEIKHTINNKQ
jgi:hypothetical protein